MNRLLFYPQSFGLNNVIIKDLMLKTDCNTLVVSDDTYIEDVQVQWVCVQVVQYDKSVSR